MLIFFEYMLKISGCYTVVYLFYWLVLRRLTSYKVNRFYFLVMFMFAFIMPLLRPYVFINPQTFSGLSSIKFIPTLNITRSANEYIPEKSIMNASLVLLAIFIGGIVVCLARFLMQLISLKKITSKADLANTVSGVKLYHLNMAHAA